MRVNRLVRRIGLLLRLGLTVKEAGRILSLRKSTVHDRASQNGLLKRRRGLTAKKKKRLRTMIEAGRSATEIVATIGVDWKTVAAYRKQSLDRVGAFSVQPLRQAVTCPGCKNKIAVQPCVICAARAAKPGKLLTA